MKYELLNQLRGTEEEEYERLGFGDDLAKGRKKQSQPASQRSQLSQTSGGRAPRARPQQALAPFIDPTSSVPRPPPSVSHRSWQSRQQQSRVLELQAQELANMQPGHEPLHALLDDGLHDHPMPATMLMAPSNLPMDDPVSVVTFFLVGGYMKDPHMKEVRGSFVQSLEHSLVSSSLAAMGKRGIEPGLPLLSHGTGDKADMTVVVPVVTLDGRPATMNVDIRARVDYDLEGYNYILGWRAYKKIQDVRNGLPSASAPGGSGSFGSSGPYGDPAAANMGTFSPPPSSAYTNMYQGSDHHPQASMNPGTAQWLPVSPFQDSSLDHVISTYDTYDALLNDTEIDPEAMADPQTGPMPTGTEWAYPTFITHVPDLQNPTTPNPMVSGTEASGTNGHRGGSPDPLAQHELIRSNVMDTVWWPPPT